MNYAAAAAGTGADADSSGGAVVLSENEASAAVGTEVAEASADEAGTAENGKEMANSADTENGQSSRKLIRTFNLDAETTDFDNLVTQLQQETQNLGGYVESSYVNGNSYYTENSRYASLTLRIPKDKTDDFLGTVGEMANVTSRSGERGRCDAELYRFEESCGSASGRAGTADEVDGAGEDSGGYHEHPVPIDGCAL